MPSRQDLGSSHGGSVPTIITINNEEGELVEDKLLTKSNGIHKEKMRKKKEDGNFLDPSSASDLTKLKDNMGRYSNFDKNWVSSFNV